MKLIEPIAVTDTGNFSRASIATYWDADGVLQTAAIDEPRWQWDPETGEFEGLLVEAAGTNYLFPSDMSTHTDLGFTRTVVTGPDGVAASATRLTETTDNVQRRLRDTTENPILAAIGESVTLYVILRPSPGRGNVALLIGTSNTDSTIQEFNVTAGTIGEASSSDGTISGAGVVVLADGWYLVWMTLTLSVAITTAGGWVFFSNVAGNGNSTYTGDGAGYLEIYHMQIEHGASYSSPIPTTSAAATRAADVMGDAMMLSNIPETDETEYNPVTAYDIGDRCMVTSASQHNVYESLTAANTGNDPTLEADPIDAPVNWQFIGKTNVWKPFDQYGSSQASQADRIVYSVVAPAGTLVDSVVLMNADATAARVIITDADAGEVYNAEHDLVSESGIIDYWEYFFAPVRKMKNLTVTDLDVYSGARVDVELTQAGEDVLLGVLVIGLSNYLGATMYGLSLSSTDYSIKRIDGSGNVTLTERPYSDEMSMQLWVENVNIAAVKEQLNRVRATPIVYIAADHYSEATTVYGWHESWDTVISYPSNSILTANIKGLT